MFQLRNKYLSRSTTDNSVRDSIVSSRKPLEELRRRRQIHKAVPWIESPLKGIDEESHVFSQRHEASVLELFFDLFFVANLATFTTYHAITDWTGVLAYIGFFVIIWATWFQVTLHDTRFARDTIYERLCKAIQMISFVGFAVVSKEFAPGTADANAMNFQLLTWVLFTTRILLAVQYGAVISFVPKSARTGFFTPLWLHVATYTCSAVAFGAMSMGFNNGTEGNVVAVWWVVLALETFTVTAISMINRRLSFKKTHLVERMSLLTLIVIGEGAIGVTKTISAVSTSGLDMENSWLIVCIILILVSHSHDSPTKLANHYYMFIWMIYFDRLPHGHYGTIRQQIGALLHFPIHLSIVGVVEGAQQVLRSRYGYRLTQKFDKYFIDYCFKQNLDGRNFTAALGKVMLEFKLPEKIETIPYVPGLVQDIFAIGNQTGICSKISLAGANYYDNTMPGLLTMLKTNFHGTLYVSTGTKIKPDYPAAATSLESFAVVYVYYFASWFILTAAIMFWLSLIRKHRVDAADWMSQGIRALALIIFAVLLTLASNDAIRITIMRKTPAILPASAGILLIILLVDRIGIFIANRRNVKSGDALSIDEENEHSHASHSDRSGGYQQVSKDPKDDSDNQTNDSMSFLRSRRASDSTLTSYKPTSIAEEYVPGGYLPGTNQPPPVAGSERYD